MKNAKVLYISTFLFAASILFISAANAQQPPNQNESNIKDVKLTKSNITADNGTEVIAGPVEEKLPDENQYVALKSEATLDMRELQKRIVYPEDGYRTKAEGRVIVKALVNREGKPVRAKIQSSDSRIFEQNALEAIMNSQFTPAMNMDGQPVSSWISVPISYKCK